MTALRPGTSPPPVRMPMRRLTMPTSQDWHVAIIGGSLAIRHRRAAKARKIAMGIIADRAPLGAKPRSGSAARGRGFGEELPNNPEESEATIAAVHESLHGTNSDMGLYGLAKRISLEPGGDRRPNQP